MKAKQNGCKGCGNKQFFYQIPTNFILRAIGIEKYWCHKCGHDAIIWSLNPQEYNQISTDDIQN